MSKSEKGYEEVFLENVLMKDGTCSDRFGIDDLSV